MITDLQKDTENSEAIGCFRGFSEGVVLAGVPVHQMQLQQNKQRNYLESPIFAYNKQKT